MDFRFKNLSLEPYRLFFGIGVLYSILAVGVWFTWMHLLDHSIIFFQSLEGPGFIHSHVMIYGVVSFYVFGFILTAFPRFVGQALPSPRLVLGLCGGLFLSQLFFLLGTFSAPLWLYPAGILETAAFLGVWLFLLGRYRRQRNGGPTRQPAFILVAFFLGTVGSLLSYLYYAFHLSFNFYTLSIELGTYGYLLFLVIAVTYRIVPFFTSRVIPAYVPRQGPYTLEIVFGLITLRIITMLVLQNSVTQQYASWVINFILLIVLANEWRKWLNPGILRIPIVWVLYLALGWILIFLGFSLYELLTHLTHPELPVYPVLRTPALHALYIGCFGTLLLGISTRVVRGHGGLPLVADKPMKVALVFIQLAALIRVFLPVLEPHWPIFAGKNYWSGFFWVAAFTIWAWRYVPFLGRGQTEGK